MATPPRNPDPHSSIKYPTVYEGLRKHGYSKEAAARISNSGPEGWREGGRHSHQGGRHPFDNKVQAARTTQSNRQSAMRSKTIPKAR